MSGPASRLACAACGAVAATPFPWRCPNVDRGDDLDHLMTRTLDLSRLRFPADAEADPFVRYRRLLHSWQVGQGWGMPDAEYLARVRRLGERCASASGRGFRVTPMTRQGDLEARVGVDSPGALWVKDETGNVAGSHKARHLMGLALDLEVMEWRDPGLRAEHDRRGLAIASCGNAALAAAVVARAADRPLEVFVPSDADAALVAEIGRLGARVTVCDRGAGQRGDPAMAAFRRAVAAGAIPFCCQGSENGLAIEGGETLAWEMASAIGGNGGRLDRLFVQVGGGALACACIQGLAEAVALGVLHRLPRIHAVQAEGGFPLVRAYRRVRARALSAPTEWSGRPPASAAPAIEEDDRLARLMWSSRRGPEVIGALDYARRHRSEFMWPWDEAPRSVARGILDDETYDWLAVVRGMIETDGYPVVVSEARLEEAHRLALVTTGIAVDPTGTAGLAGLLELGERHLIPRGESVAVLFTGAARPAGWA
jgi:threonine synthase